MSLEATRLSVWKFFFAEPGNVFVKVGIRRLSVRWEQGLLDRQGTKIDENAHVCNALRSLVALLPASQFPFHPYDSLLALCRPSYACSSSLLDIKDTPGLMYPPSTISLMSQSPISISLRRRMATIAFMLHFCRRTEAPLQGCYFPHFQRATLLAARRDLHLQISILPAASGDTPALSPSWTWPAPIIPSHPPSRTCPRCSRAYQAHPRSHTQFTLIPALPDPVHACT
ncbi:hypothetical protein EDB86DRAFT_1239990 [Lactarius hatsudake]|nr:hypothetical protein EDB86DRAFT_1239990 [Lactarius hatsudake]